MIENAKYKSFLRTNKEICGQTQYRRSKCFKNPNHEESKELIDKFIYVQKCKNIKRHLKMSVDASVRPDLLQEFIKYSETLSDLYPL
jgi:hypothetical protein